MRLVMAALLLAVACGTPDAPTDVTGEPEGEPATEQPSSEDPDAVEASPPENVEAPEPDGTAAPPDALDVSARVLGGGTLELAAFAGDPVALWMWAPW